jgi:hypothetical protein
MFVAAALNHGIGVLHGDHDMSNSSIQDFLRTGRGSTDMIAGFKGNKQGRPLCSQPRIIDGIDFSMGSAN